MAVSGGGGYASGMAEYSTKRRPDAVPALKRITSSEATSDVDFKRRQKYELMREAIADDIRKQTEKPKKSFAALVKKK